MSRSLNLQRYVKFPYVAITKCISSAGQTQFCMDAVSQLLLNSAKNPNQYYFSGLAITAGFLVNTTLKLPVIYQHYVAIYNQSKSKEIDQFKRLTSKALYYLLIVFGFISAEISDPLNAYLGSIVIMENIFSFVSIDIHDYWWKELITQSYGVIFAIGIALANYAYDFRFIKENIHITVELVDKRILKYNKSLGMTLLFSLPVLVGAPVLNFFFTQPAIEKVPGMALVLNKTIIQIIATIIAVASFVKCLAALPSIYSIFDDYYNSNKRSIVNNAPHNCKNLTFKLTAGFSGLIDSIASGLCMLVSVISFAQIIFKLSDEQRYDWQLLATASLFALSQAIQNALFGLYPGYKETMKIVNTNQVVGLPVLTSKTPIRSTFVNYGSIDTLSHQPSFDESAQFIEDDDDEDLPPEICEPRSSPMRQL